DAADGRCGAFRSNCATHCPGGVERHQARPERSGTSLLFLARRTVARGWHLNRSDMTELRAQQQAILQTPVVTAKDEVDRGERFAFGRNWQQVLRMIDEDRVRQARG